MRRITLYVTDCMKGRHNEATVKPPQTVTSDHRSPPIYGRFSSPRSIFLYISPLLAGHLPPPVSGHEESCFWDQIPSVKRSKAAKNGQNLTKKKDFPLL